MKVVVGLDVIVIVAWLSYAFAYRKDFKRPEIRQKLWSYLVIAAFMIVFVGLLAWKFRSTSMVPGTGSR